jgi:hypothetical protein
VCQRLLLEQIHQPLLKIVQDFLLALQLLLHQMPVVLQFIYQIAMILELYLKMLHEFNQTPQSIFQVSSYTRMDLMAMVAMVAELVLYFLCM